MHNRRRKTPGVTQAVLWVMATVTLVAPHTATTHQHRQMDRTSWGISIVCAETHGPMGVLHTSATNLATAVQPGPGVYTVRSLGAEETVSIAPRVPAALLRALLMEQRMTDLVELHVPEALLRSLATEGWE